MARESSHAQRLAIAEREFPQARARATYGALLHAAREVFSQRGFDAAQTPEIAERAGVSVGTFYRYFDDKRQIFVEVIRHYLAEAHRRVMERMTAERFSGADRRDSVDTVVEILFEQVRRYPELERVYLEMSLRDPEVSALRDAFESMGHEALTQLIEQVVPPGTVPDARAAAHVIQVAALDVAFSQAGLRGVRRVSDRAARTALREMFYRFLFPDIPASKD